jgi:hypothetical protein
MPILRATSAPANEPAVTAPTAKPLIRWIPTLPVPNISLPSGISCSPFKKNFRTTTPVYIQHAYTEAAAHSYLL